MTVRTSVLWKINIRMAKKWPEKVIQRSLLKEHSFVNRLYISGFFSKPFVYFDWYVFSILELKVEPTAFYFWHPFWFFGASERKICWIYLFSGPSFLFTLICLLVTKFLRSKHQKWVGLYQSQTYSSMRL